MPNFLPEANKRLLNDFYRTLIFSSENSFVDINLPFFWWTYMTPLLSPNTKNLVPVGFGLGVRVGDLYTYLWL